MRKFIFAIIAAAIAGVPVVTVVKAEETTVIHKGDGMGEHKTIIKKHDDRLVGPREEKKVIIRRDRD
jgi:adenine/guanine phosphoribosyltransferase-like PRPP-binding protein